MRRVLLPLAALLAMAGTAAPAAAFDATGLRAVLAREMRAAGPSSGAIVRDLDAGRDLFAVRADSARIPASIAKLYTTATALLRLGPQTTLSTGVVSDAEVDDAGVLRGDLVLVGGGDPFFGTYTGGRLADSVKAAGITRIAGSVVGDESGFDGLRSTCCTRYDPDLGGVLSALAYDRGVDRGRVRLDAARFAATRFAAQLKAAGVRSDRPPRAGTAPPGAGVVASLPSLDVRTLIRFVNVPSNNFAAEMLLKDLGVRIGVRGTTRGGAAVVRTTLGELGVRARVADGSGLSRSNRTSPRDVLRLLERMDRPDVGPVFRASLAVAGRTGTVKRRMRRTAAFERCRVKTGTLRAVSGLAGYCRTAGGRDIAFAFMFNRANTYAAKAREDRMTAAIARLEGAPELPPPTGGAEPLAAGAR